MSDPIVVDFCGLPIMLRREKGEYLWVWRELVRNAVKNDSPLLLRNWKFQP